MALRGWSGSFHQCTKQNQVYSLEFVLEGRAGLSPAIGRALQLAANLSRRFCGRWVRVCAFGKMEV